MSDRSDISLAQNAPPTGGAFFFGLHGLSLLLLCALVYACYSPGAGFGLAFDDVANLIGLATVRDADSALIFVFAGDAGPLGRPLSLASFLPYSGAWVEQLDLIIRANIGLHLVNALLVAQLARRLAAFLPEVSIQPGRFAVAVAALWATSPLLMSTSLMAVQRMTSLSALFCLLGMIAWLDARVRLEQRPWRSLTGMSVAVLLCTAAAALSKETGALLPLFIMVIEFGLVRHRLPAPLQVLPQALAWMGWRLLVFGLPILGILYLGWRHLADVDAAYAGFGYGPVDRLLTQAGVLFEYLHQIVVPKRSGLGPFHDDVLVSSNLSGLLLSCCWLVSGVLAWRLRNGKYRAYSFAYAWFLVGHLLESTIFPLEPYFEHRNYLPAVGVWIGVCALLWSGIGTLRHAGTAVLAVLLLNNLFVLRETGLVWSDPVIAGRIWHEEHPDSMRALLQYGRSLGERGQVERSVQVYDAASPRLQATAHYQAGRLQLYCATRPPERVEDAMRSLENVLGSGRIDYHAPESVGVVMQLAAAERCKGFDIGRGRAILEAIATSTDSRVMPRARRAAHAALADYWISQSELDPTIRHLEEVWLSSGEIADMRKIVRVLLSARLCEVAVDRFNAVSLHEPANPLKRVVWRYQRDGMAQDIASGCGSAAAGGKH